MVLSWKYQGIPNNQVRIYSGVQLYLDIKDIVYLFMITGRLSMQQHLMIK